MSLAGRLVLVTGGARRLGRALSLALAHAGARVIIHSGHSSEEAAQTLAEIEQAGGSGWTIQADLQDLQQAGQLIARCREFGELYALVNSAAIFEALDWNTTSLPDWQRHLDINLTAPFLLSQAFARGLPQGAPAGVTGRIVNILDWRALRPGADHLPYTISKAALAALTRSMAAALAPRITVNAVALGAILPPSDGAASPEILKSVPAGRWASLDEVTDTLLFLLDGPAYISGEIIHVDGGRHLI